MPKFSKRDRKEEAICPSCGEWKTTDFTPEELQEKDWECSDCANTRLTNPQDLPENRKAKPITPYDPEFEFLTKLITLVTKQGVPVQEIKALSDAYRPLTTIDQAESLAAQIWTLATTKYRIPREWLIKKLPDAKKHASLLKKADAYNNPQEQWPAQEQAEDFSDRPVNSYAYEPEKVSSTPEQDQKTLMAVAWDLVVDMFFTNHAKWSDVIKELKNMYPTLTDEDITQLRNQVRHSLDVQTNNIQSKKKHGLTFDDVILALEGKEPKPVRIDYKERIVEFADGSKLSFEDATKKALEIPKEGDAGNPDAGTGFYDTPGGADLGKRPEGDFPSSSWMPSGTADMDAEYWDNIDSALSKKEISKIAKAKNSVPRSEATHQVKLFDGRGVQYFANEKDANEFYDIALKEGKDPSKVQTYSFKVALSKKELNKIALEVSPRNPLPLIELKITYTDDEAENMDTVIAAMEKARSAAALDDLPFDIESIYKAMGNQLWLDVYAQSVDEAVDKITSFFQTAFGNQQRISSKISLRKKAHCGPCTPLKLEVIKLFSDLKHKDPSQVEDSVLEDLSRLSAESDIKPFLQRMSEARERLDATKYSDIVEKLYNLSIALSDIQEDLEHGTMTVDKSTSKKKSNLKKRANPSTRYWIAPDGKEFPVAGVHGSWIQLNKDILKQYGITVTHRDMAWQKMMESGWTRISNEPAGTGFQIQVADMNNLPSYIDDFIAKNYTRGDRILLGDQKGGFLEIKNPFPTLQRAINRELSVRASLKKADISGRTINDIIIQIEETGGATYNLSKGNLAGTENYAVAIYPDRERIEQIAIFDDVENYIHDNMDLLSDSNNSFGAWAHDGKVYFDVIATVPDQEEALELGRKNNQLAIFDLKTKTEIPTGVKREAAKQKTAEDSSPLTQEQQDQIAASSSPVYNIAIDNFYEAAKRGHSKDRSLAYAVDSVKNLEQIDPKKLTELINTYLVGLI